MKIMSLGVKPRVLRDSMIGNTFYVHTALAPGGTCSMTASGNTVAFGHSLPFM